MYSKITSIELINFMVYSHARVSFDESGILNLKGYNSSGKSTIERALQVCFTDAYKRNQQKFIRYDCDYFRIIVEFDDGVRIVRDKYINGQSLYEMYKYDELLFTTKEGNKLTKITDVPDVIKKYLGLVVLEDGCLNFQSRRDPLWLIETVGSANYYALNEVLKTESIAMANALLNSDKNKLGSELGGIDVDLRGVESALEGCGDVTEELISALSEREMYAQGICDKLELVRNIGRILRDFNSIIEYPAQEKIKSDRLVSISGIQSNILEIENMPEVSKIEKVETKKFADIQKLVAGMLEYDRVDGTEYIVPDKIIDVRSDIQNLINAFSRYVKSANELSKVSKEQKKVKADLDKVVEKAHESGIRFVKCKNCGSYMEVGEEVG